MPLPVSILLPTRNSAGPLPGHLRTLAPLLPRVEAVVHVDSHSQDGTAGLVAHGIGHPRLLSLSHPPGLYQSWNFGLRHVPSEYAYISTVGDSIAPDGLDRLHAVAAALDADVVVSVPALLGEDGRPHRKPWPIHRIVAELGLTRPTALPPRLAFLLAVAHIPDALLGSSASNLYRTRVMQQRPFPLEFGTAGDAGWALAHALHVRMALLPESFSIFHYHPKTYSPTEYRVENNRGRMLAAAWRAATGETTAGGGPGFPADFLTHRLQPYFETLRKVHACQDRIEAYRERRPLPWSCYPGAWRARLARNRQRRTAVRLLRGLLESPEVAGGSPAGARSG